MILVCKNCKSSFLVPAGLFSDGPRKVKCAKCGESWTTDRHGKSLLKSKVSKEDVAKKTKELRQAAKEKAEIEDVENPKPIADSNVTDPAVLAPTDGPDYFSVKEVKKLILSSISILVGILVLLSLIFVLFHNQIIQFLPSSQHLYISIGLVEAPDRDTLFLRDVTSIRRYQEGAMRLIVKGTIYNQSEERHVIPEIRVEAMGPDRRLIKCWNIPPAQATIKPKHTVSFSSAILSPKESVSEVNLRFIKTIKNDD